MELKLNIRSTKITDYEELKEWWNWHRFPPPNIELLDGLKYGLMVSYGGDNICAGFIYFTNAKAYGMLEFIVSTYKIRDKVIRKKAIEFLINCLKEVAKNNGVQYIWSSVRNENLIKHYLDCEFSIGSKKTTELICKL
ncbi:hypothetical protein SAMN04489761_4277 [Tenacibaculum sp. MAR_2009_124]|uniref:hypothetical protein n=1 Tax=Tenacibaculum sp. MAR_2009_124 TaxID=1250059 RepID=UPI0008945490|nr:hypothetical protein [Tenacibaculum sp. MAR_2009_124]SED10145.1 hypothetical protein SAMN04489761_4277 [Tenacibaculum sp. MAR_2009_124]